MSQICDIQSVIILKHQIFTVYIFYFTNLGTVRSFQYNTIWTKTLIIISHEMSQICDIQPVIILKHQKFTVYIFYFYKPRKS